MENASRNKWIKYKYMLTKELLPYLPETRYMTQDSLWSMIKKYKHVIVKPIKGSRGKGVIQVSSIRSDIYRIHYENKRFQIQGKEKTFRYLKRKMGSQEHLVQRRISRPKVNGRPFDIRVIVQRKSDSNSWKVTGKVAKIAGKGYIVSNISRSKGTVTLPYIAIKKSSIQKLSAKTLVSKINKVSILTARRLEHYFDDHRIYGLDIALDSKGNVWIIEANLFPILSHFRKMKNQKMYNRIMRYKQE